MAEAPHQIIQEILQARGEKPVRSRNCLRLVGAMEKWHFNATP